MAQVDVKIDTIESLKVEKTALQAEQTALLAKIQQLTEDKDETDATIQETLSWNAELKTQVAALQAQVDAYKQSVQSDTTNQSLVLKKMEKLSELISASEMSIDSGTERLSESEAEVVKVHRRDKINELKQQKKQLRSIISRSDDQ